MKSKPDCIPCYLKQVLSTAVEVTDNPSELWKVLVESAKIIPQLSMNSSPAENSTYAVWKVNEILGCKDPFAEKKKFYNEKALSMYPELIKIVDSSEDKIDASAKLAVVGNIIDLGISANIDIESTINEVFSDGFTINHIEYFKEDLKSAKRVLYLGDNAGEVVFDKVFIEEIKKSGAEVIFAVRSKPVLNDVTMIDAIDVGLDKVAEVIETGSPMIGIVLETCSDEFIKFFNTADIIISKGQGNFETLDETDANIYFILKAKCSVVAQRLSVKFGDVMLIKNKILKDK